jgi:single-stranded-DNA-specific exonuclease
VQPKSKRWQILPRVSSLVVARFPQLHPLLIQVLYNRGLSTPEEVQAFLSPESLIGNPFQLRGMSAAVERLRRAVRAGEPIAVYGDFDVDGVTATALLVQALESIGAQVRPYIPHRVDEGYGLNLEALKQLQAQGVRVVVTVDLGVRSLDEVAFGKEIELDMIVTDHHTPGDELPDALAVINPKQPHCPYPSKELSGAGIAFKLAQALLRAETSVPLGKSSQPIAENCLLELVALGTVADLVPLTGENRALVKRGL